MDLDSLRLMGEIGALKSRLEIVEQMTFEKQEQGVEERDKFAFPIGNVQAGGNPGPYEPEFDDEDKLTNVGAGLYPFGRQFYDSVTVDDGAKVKTGFIGLEISHSSSEEEVSAKVVKLGNGIGAVNNTDLTKTRIPLYYIEDGAIEIDLRCLMALAVRE